MFLLYWLERDGTDAMLQKMEGTGIARCSSSRGAGAHFACEPLISTHHSRVSSALDYPDWRENPL